MASIRTQFSRKLHIAFGVLLIITLTIAWYFLTSVRGYEHDLQTIAKSNEVLHGYEDLSNLTFQKTAGHDRCRHEWQRRLPVAAG